MNHVERQFNKAMVAVHEDAKRETGYNGLDLAVEAVVLRLEFDALYSDEEREIARERLASYGYGTPA